MRAGHVFVAGERCGGLTPGPRYVESETLAAIVAHEERFWGLTRDADTEVVQLALQAQVRVSSSGLVRTFFFQRTLLQAAWVLLTQSSRARSRYAWSVPSTSTAGRSF